MATHALLKILMSAVECAVALALSQALPSIKFIFPTTPLGAIYRNSFIFRGIHYDNHHFCIRKCCFRKTYFWGFSFFSSHLLKDMNTMSDIND